MEQAFMQKSRYFPIFGWLNSTCIFYIYMEIWDRQWIYKVGAQRRGLYTLSYEFYFA